MPTVRHLISLCLLAVLVACGGDGDGDEKRKKRPVPVTVVELAEVARGEVADLLLASATVEAERAAAILPNATGRVVSISADVGDRVKKGEVLAVLENVSLDAGAERAAAEVRNLEARFAEMEKLFQSGAVSERELEDVRYQLTTARTSLREATTTAGETKLVAPFGGVVSARDLKVGELATSATTAFQVVDLTDLRVRARLPERDVSRVAVGQKARLVSAYDAERSAMAEVTRISPVIDASTGTFEVVLRLEAGQSVLRPGQYVSVELQVDVHDDVVLVPKDAVVYDNGVPVVYRYEEAPPEPEPEADDEAEGDDAEGDEPAEDEGPRWIARRVPVDVGLADTRNAEIVEGLEAGERIVVVGQTMLRDGARVRDVADAAAAKAAAEAKAAEAKAAASDDDEG